MIQIVITVLDDGTLKVNSSAAPYVVIGELAKATALLTSQLVPQETRRIVAPSNGGLALPPNRG